MKIERTVTRTTLLALPLSLFACASQKTAVKEDQGVQVAVDHVLPKAESLDASAIEVRLKVLNPRDRPTKIERVDYEIDTKEVSGVLKGSSPAGTSIEAGQTAEVTFNQSVPFPQEKEAYEQVISRGTIPANLRGSVVLGDGTKLPFEKRGEVAVPTLPKFVVNDAQAARYEKEGLDVTIFLRLINENVFPVTVEGVRYTVFIEDKKIKSEQAAIGARLIAGAAEEYEVTTKLDGKSFDKAKVKQILSSGRLTYRVEGKVSLARLEIPFEHTGEIELGSNE